MPVAGHGSSTRGLGLGYAGFVSVHLKDATPLPPGVSCPMYSNVAVVDFVGPRGTVDDVIPVLGAWESMVQVHDSGAVSTLPAASTARTISVCEPSPRFGPAV